jgi:guanylate kinase
MALISAPSGAGKTTLCQNLLNKRPEFTRVITCTTRPPRPRERHGVDYYFLTPEAFAVKEAAGEFLESATVFGNRYGTLTSEVLTKLRAGKDVLLNIDVQGAESVRAKAKADPELKTALVTIFLTPPTFAELECRLRKRGTESPEVLERRLGIARKEIARWNEFEYLLVSGTMDEDLRRLEAILDAEKLRQFRAHPPVI